MRSDNPANRIETVQIGELTCWRIHSAYGEALVARQGAQLLSYRAHGEQPLIWLSDTAEYRRGQSLRGGVPVCWPWFGDLARNPAAVQAGVDSATPPAHGLVRGLDWELNELREEHGAVTAHFRLDLRQGLPGWPHSVELSLAMHFGERLRLTLSTHNLGDQPLTISQALHTYFAVSDSRAISIDGLHGCRYIETLESWEERRQDGPVLIQGETDRIYLDVEQPLAIRDPQWQRSVLVRAESSRSAVVWNPWVEKSRRLSQFPEDAWQRMLCIETARVWDDLLSIAPGSRESMSVEIWSEALPA